jgi:hypothetical protein
MSKIKKGSLENKKWEGTGDAIIKIVIFENLHRLPARIEGEQCLCYLNSNKYFCTVRDSLNLPMKFRHKNNPVFGSKNHLSRRGDEVEYYVAFLYFNYGMESAKRFIMKNLLDRYIIE